MHKDWQFQNNWATRTWCVNLCTKVNYKHLAQYAANERRFLFRALNKPGKTCQTWAAFMLRASCNSRMNPMQAGLQNVSFFTIQESDKT